MSLMDQMRSEGIVPNVYCFSSLINACGKVRSEDSTTLSVFHTYLPIGSACFQYDIKLSSVIAGELTTAPLPVAKFGPAFPLAQPCIRL